MKKAVSFRKLYRYANCLYTIVILLAVLFGVVAGVSLPLLLYVLGLTMNQFINYAVSIQFTNGSVSSDDYFCNVTTSQSDLNDYLTSNDPAFVLQNNIPTNTYYTLSLSVILFISATLSRYLWSVSASYQARQMRLDYLKSVLTRHVGWFDINSSGELHTHLSQGIQTIETGIGVCTGAILQGLVNVISSFLIGFAISWKLTAVITSLLVVLYIVFIIMTKIITMFIAKKQNALAKAGSVAEEVLSSIKTVMAFGGQNEEIKRYHSHLKQAKKESHKHDIVLGLVFGTFSLFLMEFYAVGYWYGTILFVECSILVGDLFMVIILIVLGSMTLGECLPELQKLSAAFGSATIVYAVIDQESEINPGSGDGIIPDYCEGSIQFSNVSFNYPSRPDVQILHGLDLSVKPGQTVALVGSSGCGKSTVSKLIPRIYDIIEGSISLDGIDIRDLNISWLRNQIGVVSQEPVLFNVSIAENISYGKEDTTIEEIEMAAKAANAHDFISELPDGYNTLVGEGGAQLSGGQKQRVAIARALVRDPKILLLDEATSALDTESEKVVQDALNKARKGRSTIIVAHRLSTIQTADVIVGIDNGHVVEMGSHNELMKREGLYYQLVLSQKIEESEDNKKDSIQIMQTQKSVDSTISDIFTKLPSIVSDNEPPQYSEVFQQKMEMRDLTEEPSEDSPLLEQKTSTVFTTTAGEEHTIILLKDILVLCFNKIHWFFLIVGVLGYGVAITIVYSFSYLIFDEVAKSLSQTNSDELLKDVNTSVQVLGSFGFLLLVLFLISIISFGICEQQLSEKVRQKSFRAMLKQDISWFDQPENPVSVLSHKLAVEASNITKVIDIHMASALRAISSVMATTIIAFILSWAIALVVIPPYLLLLLGGYLQVILTKAYAGIKYKLIEDSAKVAIESIDNVYTVATLGIESRLVRKYNQLLEQPLRYDRKGAATNGVLNGFSQSIVPFIVGVGYIAGVFLYTSNTNKVYYADYAEIFVVLIAVWVTGNVFQKIFSVLPDSRTILLSTMDVLSLVSQKPMIDAFSEDGLIPERVTGNVDFQNVYFTYPSRPGVSVLEGFNISIKSGQTLALVGPSGSGKSTIISLMERFYDPAAGCILLDGVNLHDLNISWLRRQISLVSQEPILFDMSIADNIRYGALFREVTDEEVIEAAKSANIHDFIQSLPEGYSTNVGVKGTQLSGGQKQRVAIARALVRDPKILLLDEATSALDTESEKIVQDALDKARKGRTTIIIAHRLSTVYNSDSIAVLDKGHVIEQGTHSELMNQQGVYYMMNNTQSLENTSATPL